MGLGHDHGPSSNGSVKVLVIAMVLALAFATIEVISGFMANSLALISDGGHMAADALALGLAAVAAWIAAKLPSDKHTYGLGRAEVIGAWISAMSVLAIGIAIIVEAIERINTPEVVEPTLVVFVGAAGIIINTIIAWVLTHGEQTLNVRAAILHVMSDLLGSFAALITGVVIFYTGWTKIDPILSIFIAVLILISSAGLLRESLKILMEGVPGHLDISEVGSTLAKVEHVRSVHDLHIWTLSSGRIAMTAHIEVDELNRWETLLPDLKKILHDQFDISHITLQPETHYQTIQHMPNHCQTG